MRSKGFVSGFEKTALIPELAGKALSGLGSAAVKGVAAPVKVVGKAGSRLLGLHTTEGKVNAGLGLLGALGDYSNYAEKFKEAAR